jgi:hypothetical protein
VSVTVEELLAVFGEVAAGADSPVLIGGLAVHLRTRAATLITSPEDAVRDPSLLASVVRPTQDIDIVVRRKALASTCTRLGELRFSVVPGNTRRFSRADVVVDVLTPDVPFTGLAFEKGSSSPVALADGGSSAPVATLDVLVVTKCRAFLTRKKDRDLVDIARLALRDLREATLPRRLAQLLDDEAQIFELFATVRQEFLTSGGRGPTAFFQAVLNASDGVHAAGWLTREPDIRELVVISVQQMLAECDLDLDA